MKGPLKYHGGKSYLAPKIVALMPKHLHYVEPYFGGGSVLFAKDPEGISEVANDLDYGLMRFWTVLQDPRLFQIFKRRVEATPFSEFEWSVSKAMVGKLDKENAGDIVYEAIHFFITCRQSLAGRGKSFAPLSKTRVRRGMNEQASAWLSAIEGLPEVHKRLQRVVILNREALDVIQEQDGPDTLFYLDPPYLHETRVGTDEYGLNEMSYTDHEALVDLLCDIKGKFLLSGYYSNLYDDRACFRGWHRHQFDLPNNAAGGKTKRRMTECLWTNF